MIILVVVMVVRSVALSDFDRQKKVNLLINDLPEEVKYLPIPNEDVETISYLEDSITIIGRTNRSRQTSTIVDGYYEYIDLKDYTYTFMISDSAIDNGYFELVFTRKK